MSAEPSSVRLRLDLAYDGTHFHGWAAQPGLRTVEGILAEALTLVMRRPVQLTVAGRTDAGVHARAQVAHVDITADEALSLELETLRRRLQGLLSRTAAEVGGADVVLHRIARVSSDFDARFSAVGRSYCYRLADASAPLDPLARTNVWWQPQLALDVAAASRAAAVLVGEHDFLSFCRPREGATTIRTLTACEVARGEGGIVEFRPRADAFCHSMVRSLVGALIEVARGKRDEAWLRRLVDQPSRAHGVPIVPARGLTLEGVEYPPPGQWGERARTARAVRELPCC